MIGHVPCDISCTDPTQSCTVEWTTQLVEQMQSHWNTSNHPH